MGDRRYACPHPRSADAKGWGTPPHPRSADAKGGYKRWIQTAIYIYYCVRPSPPPFTNNGGPWGCPPLRTGVSSLSHSHHASPCL